MQTLTRDQRNDLFPQRGFAGLFFVPISIFQLSLIIIVDIHNHVHTM